HIYAEQQTHEPLVDLATFEACQRRLAQGRSKTTPKRGGGELLLTGLLRCGHCGGRMKGRGGTPDGRQARYSCRSFANLGRPACTSHSSMEAPLVGAIVRKLKERFTPEFFDLCRRQFIEQAQQGPGPDAELTALQSRLANLASQRDRAARQLLTEAEEDEALA